MAEEKMKFLGYACDGSPMYAPEVCQLSNEEMKKMFLQTLDIIEVFNGREYFDFGDGRYFARLKNGEADLTHILTIDRDGNILKDEPFEF
ncbi:MAG: hypothetical protein IJ855_05415 [Bacteroidales bacterium]|nr:hypothetical protein [Bacteroidales bacterium]